MKRLCVTIRSRNINEDSNAAKQDKTLINKTSKKVQTKPPTWGKTLEQNLNRSKHWEQNTRTLDNVTAQDYRHNETK